MNKIYVCRRNIIIISQNCHAQLVEVIHIYTYKALLADILYYYYYGEILLLDKTFYNNIVVRTTESTSTISKKKVYKFFSMQMFKEFKCTI